MAAIRKQLSILDFGGYENLNQVIQNLASAPSAFGKGHVYFDTTVNRLRLYNGTKWVDAGGVTSIASANADIAVTDDTNGNFLLTLNSSTAATPDTVAKRDSSGNLYAANLSGTNTGDQTITLTGEATGSGTGSFAVTLTNSAVISKVLTGFSSAVGGNVSAADSILSAFGKLENRMALNDAKMGVYTVTPNMALVSGADGLYAASAVTDVELGYLSGVTSAIQTQINGKEATIVAGTSAQYWRGDKTWQTLDTSVVPEGSNQYFTEARVLSTLLAGFTVGTGVVSASDGLLAALGKLQGQINGLDGVSHDQNTDLGTTSSTFYLGGATGPKLKTDGTGFMLVTNDELAFADLQVQNLTVKGTLTQTNSQEVNIGDSQITLNADITAAAQNSNGGLAVKRLAADNTTRKDGELNFDVSLNRWVAVFGPTTGTLVNRPVAMRFDADLGDGTNTAFTVTHNLGTKFVSVSVQDVATGEVVDVAVSGTTATTATLEFAAAPAANAYKVTIIG